MQSFDRLKLVELNHLLTCVLCKGYFIDATTIVECLHSFCKTCIVGYLQTNNFCPTCEVQVHRTRPLLNIRSDQTLQDIVYKIVPSLFKNEMKRRREFYRHKDQNSIPSSSEKRGDVSGFERLIFTPEDIISVSLEYSNLNKQMPVYSRENMLEKKELKQCFKRYFNCPGGLRVYHLKKLLRAKYGLLNSKKKLDILYMHDILRNQYSLVDLAYIYSWKRNEPLRLTFKITQEPTSECNGTSLPHSSLPSSPTAMPIATPVLSMDSSSKHPSPPLSPQMAQEPNDYIHFYIHVEKPNPIEGHAAIPEPNGLPPEKSLKNGHSPVLVENGCRHDKSMPRSHGAAKLHRDPVVGINDLKDEKSILCGQSYAKHKSAVLGPNNLDAEKSVHDGSSGFKHDKSMPRRHGAVKLHSDTVVGTNGLKDEKSIQCEQSYIKHKSAVLGPNNLDAEKSVHDGSSGFKHGKSMPRRHGAVKLHSDTVVGTSGLKDEKSIQCEQSYIKHKSAVLGPNNLDAEKSVHDGSSDFKHGKSMPRRHGAVKLHSDTVVGTSGLKDEKSIQCEQSYIKHKSAVLGPNNLDAEKSVHDGSSDFKHGKSMPRRHGAVKLHSDTVVGKNYLKDEKSIQCGQSYIKHKSAVLGPNNLDAEKSVHDGSSDFKHGKSMPRRNSAVKLHSDTVVGASGLKDEKSIQCGQSYIKHKSAVLGLNNLDAEKSVHDGSSDFKHGKSMPRRNSAVKLHSDTVVGASGLKDEKSIQCGQSYIKHKSAVLGLNNLDAEKSVHDGSSDFKHGKSMPRRHGAVKLHSDTVVGASGLKDEKSIQCEQSYIKHKSAVLGPNNLDAEKSVHDGSRDFKHDKSMLRRHGAVKLHSDTVVGANDLKDEKSIQCEQSYIKHKSAVLGPNNLDAEKSLHYELGGFRHGKSMPCRHGASELHSDTVMEINGLENESIQCGQSYVKHKSAVLGHLDAEKSVLCEPSGFRHDKSIPRHCAAELLSSNTMGTNDLKTEKSVHSGSSYIKHKSAALLLNNLDAEKSALDGPSAKFTKTAIPEPNVLKPEKSLQSVQGFAKKHNSATLEPNQFVAKKPLKTNDNFEINSNANHEPNVCDKPVQPLKRGHSAAEPNSAILVPNGCESDNSIHSNDICDRKTNSAESVKIHQGTFQYSNITELEKCMRKGLNTNMPTAVVVLEKFDSPKFHKNPSSIISFSEFAQSLTKCDAVIGNTRKQSTGDGQSDKTNTSIPMPKLKSALKKAAFNDVISSPIESKHSANRQLLIQSDLAKKVLSKRHISPGHGLKKRVTFSVNLVQDCSSRGLKRNSPDYFDDEALFPVNGSAVSGLIHLRKKILSPKSS